MALLPSISMANPTTSYYVEKAAQLDVLIGQSQTLVQQLNAQVQKMDRYLRALEQAIVLEPLPGETNPPSMNDS